jgi:4-hydroxybenzoyl-CoA reductase subunit beta
VLPLPEFELVQAESIEEAVGALAGPPGEAMVLAGGTDLIPNLKHALHAPRKLVSLRRVRALRTVSETESGGLLLGAGLTLNEVASHPLVRSRYPALARAAGLVAGPQLRNMGTLGGNLCLDTRCLYYNQTEFWRGALGYCLKKDGDLCHVVPQGSRCVASYSADTPGPLIVYGASVTLVSTRGERGLAADDFFRADGLRNTRREPDELMTGVRLPAPAAGFHAAYEKLRMREAIDFPLLSVALGVGIENRHVEHLTLVVGGVGARPRPIKRADAVARGRVLDESLGRDLGELAYRQCHPLTTVNVDPEWRREVLPVTVRRALNALQASDVGS